MKNPKVSVIIPTYNRADLIGRAIKSVLNQTYKNFELIIVDDASTDNTKQVIEKFKDKRIKYMYCKKNLGGASARNTGIKTAKGKYIAFQDSDDKWLPQKLEKQMEVFETSPQKVGVVYTGFWRINGNKKTYIPSSNVMKKEGDIHQELLKGNFVTTQAAIVKKECFKKAGMFDERLPSGQEWELWIRISRYYCFKYVDEPLVIAYFTKNSITDIRKKDYEALQLILEKHFDDFKKDKKLLAGNYFYISNLLYSNKKIGKSRNYFFKAIKTHPFYVIFLLIMKFYQGMFKK